MVTATPVVVSVSATAIVECVVAIVAEGGGYGRDRRPHAGNGGGESATDKGEGEEAWVEGGRARRRQGRGGGAGK